jgi:hypothetical protein
MWQEPKLGRKTGWSGSSICHDDAMTVKQLKDGRKNYKRIDLAARI